MDKMDLTFLQTESRGEMARHLMDLMLSVHQMHDPAGIAGVFSVCALLHGAAEYRFGPQEFSQEWEELLVLLDDKTKTALAASALIMQSAKMMVRG